MPHIGKFDNILIAVKCADYMIPNTTGAVNNKGLGNIAVPAEYCIKDAVGLDIDIGYAVILEECECGIMGASIAVADSAEDLDAQIGVSGPVFMCLLKVGHFADAGTAPGRPVIDDGYISIFKDR